MVIMNNINTATERIIVIAAIGRIVLTYTPTRDPNRTHGSMTVTMS